MPSVSFYFEVHQPFRVRRYTVFEKNHNYFDEGANRSICQKVAQKSYLPANQAILDLIRQHDGRFRVAYSITGCALEQFERYAPEVMDSFHALAETGCVEFLAETYYHSLSFLYSREEFAAQVDMHRNKIRSLFGQWPQTFRNTELIYNNDLAHFISQMGFKTVLAEGADHVLRGRSPDFVYSPIGCDNLKLLLKNYRLSDDIAFRFSNRGWPEWPLTTEKFAGWVDRVNGNGVTVNLFMDYETFGEHQWADTGIFEFMRALPGRILQHPDNNFKTPREISADYGASDCMDVPFMVSWADTERDLSAWLGNAMQSSALHELFSLEQSIKATGDEELLRDWRMLQTSDHFYYMCTKWFADGDVHKYFNPYESPYDGYINFMNVLDNLKGRLKMHTPVAALAG
jgi:alpha-amylase